jgi:hypothetical protein
MALTVFPISPGRASRQKFDTAVTRVGGSAARRGCKRQERVDFDIGTGVAGSIAVFQKRRPPGGKVKEDCWVCSRPVYENEASVSYLGLWVHADCYDRANICLSPERRSESEKPAE